jgi:hypothetical protein
MVVGGLTLATALAAMAQRKPILAPGQPPPPPPDAPTEGSKAPAQPVVPADERVAADAGSAPSLAATKPSAPTAKPEAPAPAAAPPPKPGPPPPPPPELAFRKRFGPWNVGLRLVPGVPKPGGLIEAVFEVSRRLEAPDPVYGDRKPLEGAVLVLQVHKDSKSPSFLVALHPLLDAGEYGARFSVPERGQWSFQVTEAKKPDEEHGEVLLDAEFTVGIGEVTTMASEAAEAGLGGASARGPLRKSSGQDDADQPGLRGLMQRLGKGWIDLLIAEGDTHTTPKEISALGKTISQLAGEVKGKAPDSAAGSVSEFDLAAEHLQSAAFDLEKGLGDRTKTQQSMIEIENTNCLSCHAKYWFEITSDLSEWPTFRIKTPPAVESKRRHF